MSERLKPEARPPDQQGSRRSLRRHMAGRRFLDILYQPAPQFRQPDGSTIVCPARR